MTRGNPFQNIVLIRKRIRNCQADDCGGQFVVSLIFHAAFLLWFGPFPMVLGLRLEDSL
jgi:hypothetical protein